LTILGPVPHTVAMESEPAIDTLSFEQALRDLERIVGRLESGDTPLAEAIELYERGNALRRKCAERLDAAQARIEAIRLDAEGRPVGTAPFDGE
jgi:exodeoxyribonuclease VII small subunit